MAGPAKRKQIPSRIPKELWQQELILLRIKPIPPPKPAYRRSLRDRLYRVHAYDPAANRLREFQLNAPDRAELNEYLTRQLRREGKTMTQLRTRLQKDPKEGTLRFQRAGLTPPELLSPLRQLQNALNLLEEKPEGKS